MHVSKRRCKADSQCLMFWALFVTVLLLKCIVVNGDREDAKKKSTDFSRDSSKRPHIVLIVADDLGYNDVSFHGSQQIPTPNIDFLGYNGVILNNYYVSPICTPTRAALMTGRYPIHTGLQHKVIMGADPYGLPLNETLMPQYLNKLGYRSHMVGKWHLGFFKWQYTPVERGFDSYFGYFQGRSDYYTHTYEHNLEEWGLDFRKDKDLLRNYTGLYSTTLFRDEAVRIIEDHDKSEPLFLYLPFQAVHSGNSDGPHLQAPSSYIEKFSYIENMQRRKYAAMLSALDDAVGDVYDTLKSRGMLADSIILFTTDNGGPANGFDNNAANNFPLRGMKRTMWEGGVRAVGVLHSPLLQRQGYISNKMLHVCDWLPTLITAAGGQHLLENDTSLDGVDAWEMLNTDGKAVRSEILHNIDPLHKNSALRMGDYKLLVGKESKSSWYPPYQLSKDDYNLHYRHFRDKSSPTEAAEIQEQRKLLNRDYSTFWPTSVVKRMVELYSYSERSNLYTGPYAKLAFIFPNLTQIHSIDTWKTQEVKELLKNRVHFGFSPVRVSCGAKPSNASTNCQPKKSPCLYHIPSDPCEYNNIAMWNEDIVKEMMNRLAKYSSTMVPPANKPTDPEGNPRLHDGAWVPWR
ncbi:arylsulfatase j-like [Plakobranchus ocellatus]|uniref:Arylsulfatase j-like n=1 Tax=Plakobranchus ocellatus TaxID=259542 RepID=A0AAV4D1W3_9GAST|nr:arylsulfatase j-like [Plakobranchus ocellatus]